MRRLRIVLGLAAAVCAFGTLAAPALAKKEKPKTTFGEFRASFPNGAPITPGSPVTATGLGSEEKLELAEGVLTIGREQCKKITSTGTIDEERSETFRQAITFSGCAGTTDAGEAKHVKEVVKVPKFTIAME